MAEYTRHRIDVTEEQNMLIGLIVSNRMCKDILPLIDKDYLQNPVSFIVVDWIRNYYQKYEEAPRKDIQTIFEIEKKNLSSDRAEIVQLFLEWLSREYEKQSEINEPYLMDRSVKYLEERSLLVLAKKIEDNVKFGFNDKAKEFIADYKKVAKAMSTWFNPFLFEEVNSNMDTEGDVLFKMPGALGKLLGPFERGAFAAVMAPTKRGKTWFLLEIAIMALLNKFKVAFISMEMRKEKMAQRFYKRLLSATTEGGKVYYPIFDCINNQDGSCSMPQRKGYGDLLNSEDEVKEFDPEISWEPCDECRGKRIGDYVSSEVHWYVPLERPKFNLSSVRGLVDGMWGSFGDNLRVKCYPRFDANLEDVIRDLDLLEYTEGFVPDVVVIDDLDSARPEKSYGNRLEEIDQTWMAAGRLGSVKRCLVVVSTQSNKEAWEAKNTKARNVSGYYMKFAHVDLAFMISQTPIEKKRNLTRCSVAVSRDENFNELTQVKILQLLEAGQPIIDSEFDFS
uniref:Putative helicase n=3 Tax=viral metagenome TaxID=1070528 RepID=A0A6H1ZU29_9ZZZZ